MDRFTIEARPDAALVPFEGPISLTLELTHHGDETIEIMGDPFLDLQFEPPKGWTLRELPEHTHLQGRLPTVTLAPGQSISLTRFLHDHFASITPGEARLPITVTLRRATEGAREPAAVLYAVCVFEVMIPDPKRFEQRLMDLHRQILAASSAEKRLVLYRSVAGLSHRALLPIFVEALVDSAMLVFHATARRRLAEVSQHYGARGKIIQYLVHHGSRYDGAFFQAWQEQGVGLSEEEIQQLCEARSLWTRLFCLENFKKQYNRRGILESLETELHELMERVKKLR